MGVIGQRTSSNLLSTQFPRDVGPKLYSPELADMRGDNKSQAAALTILLSRYLNGSKVVDNFKYEVQDMVLPIREFAIDAITAFNSTSFTVAAGISSQVAVDSMLVNLKTTERYLVTAVNTATETLSIVRDYGTFLGGAAAATLATDVIRNLGPVSVEGGLSPTALSLNPEFSYNYVSTIKDALEVSNHVLNTKQYTMQDWIRMQVSKGVEHRIHINEQIWNSVRAADAHPTIAGKLLYTTGGVFQHLSGGGNDYDLAGALLTERAINDYCEQAHQNTDTIHLFMGTHMTSAFSEPLRNKLAIRDDIKKKYGVRVTEYLAPSGGRLMLVADPKMFSGYGSLAGVTTGTLANQAVGLDFSLMDLVHLKNMDTQLEQNIQENDRDGIKDQWKTTIGLRMQPGIDNTNNDGTVTQNLSPHSKILNFATYA